jgi:hypothetical protein
MPERRPDPDLWTPGGVEGRALGAGKRAGRAGLGRTRRCEPARLARTDAHGRTRAAGYFRPEDASPSITRRCSRMNRISTGAIAIRLAAIITG